MPPKSSSAAEKQRSRVCLLIRDGWGWSAEKKGNAELEAKTPHTDALMADYHHMFLSASGETVGLPKGEMVLPALAPTPPCTSRSAHLTSYAYMCPLCV
jgi:hypothetical protein